MTDKLTLLFRAQIIAQASSFKLTGTKYKRLERIALRELQEAVEQALDEFTEGLKQKLEQEQ